MFTLNICEISYTESLLPEISLFNHIQANTAQKMKFSIKDVFSKCDQISMKRRIWSYLLKESLMVNFIFFLEYNIPFPYPLKISENVWFSNVFRGYREGKLSWIGLTSYNKAIRLQGTIYSLHNVSDEYLRILHWHSHLF